MALFISQFLFAITVALCLPKIEGNDSIPDFVSDQNKSHRTLPACGETFNTATGGIYHKPFEPVVDSERCIWVLGVPEAVGYSINIEFLGPPTNVPGSGQDLTLTGVAHGNTSSPILTTYRPSSTGRFTVHDANIVIVSFHSPILDGQRSSGFAMKFDGILTGNISQTAPTSTHHIFESPTFEFKYPRTGTNYADYELAAFIFPPSKHIFQALTKDVWYKRSGLQADCLDALYVYHYIIEEGEGNWQESGQICADTYGLHIAHDDTALVLFQSDNATVSTGFWYWYTAC